MRNNKKNFANFTSRQHKIDRVFITMLQWKEVEEAFRAGQGELRGAIETFIRSHSPEARLAFGNNVVQRASSGPSGPVETTVALYISVLRYYLNAVDAATASKLTLSRPFFEFLQEAISLSRRSDAAVMSLKSMAVFVSRYIVKACTKYAEHFPIVVNAICVELDFVAKALSADQHSMDNASSSSASSPAMLTEELIIHQTSDFLKVVQLNLEEPWLAGFAASIPSFVEMIKHSASCRPQCLVEMFQALTKVLDITTRNQRFQALDYATWLAGCRDILQFVPRASVIHDSMQEALAASVEFAKAGGYWSEASLIELVGLVNQVLAHQPLHGLFDVKILECLLGIMGLFFDKGRWEGNAPDFDLHEGITTLDDRKHCSPALIDCAVHSVRIISELQDKLIGYMQEFKSKKPDPKNGTLEDVKNVCSDTRATSISTAILITIAVPEWVHTQQALFWELSTTKLRTPLLFSHAINEFADHTDIVRIANHLTSGLSQVNKYSSKDACILANAMTEICEKKRFREFLASHQCDALAVALGSSYTKQPKQAKLSKDWKLACLGALSKFIEAKASVFDELSDTTSLFPEAFSISVCDALLSDFITLHQGLGLRGGPKGSNIAEKARRESSAAVVSLIGSSEAEDCEPVLLEISGLLISFLDLCIKSAKTSLNDGSCLERDASADWWLQRISEWREFKDIDAVTTVSVSLKYCLQSLGRTAQYESDIDQMCLDMELATKLFSLQLQWQTLALARTRGGQTAGGEAVEVKRLSPGAAKDIVGTLSSVMSQIATLESGTLNNEARNILFMTARDLLISLARDLYGYNVNDTVLASRGSSLLSSTEMESEVHAALNTTVAALEAMSFDALLIPSATAAEDGTADGDCPPSKYRIHFLDLFERLVKFL